MTSSGDRKRLRRWDWRANSALFSPPGCERGSLQLRSPGMSA